MDQRLAGLLRIAVEEFVATAEPVGSRAVVERRGLEVSPATVRNWFAALEDDGYLTHPHTSGGRIPTEKGYRTYVRLFVAPKPVARCDEAALKKVSRLTDETARLKALVKALADLSGQVIVAHVDGAASYTGLPLLFSQPEFQDRKRVVSFAEDLERLDEMFADLSDEAFDEPRILLGRECPFGSDGGMVLCASEEGMLGILGPLRMDYQHAFSLLHAAFSIL